MCEECDSYHDTTGDFFVDGTIQPIVRAKCDEENELKKLSQQDRASKFCIDAGFMATVGVGQCSMTKDTA